MFLAALQLTNQGNLDLVTSGTVDGGDLQLSLELLDRNRRVNSNPYPYPYPNPKPKP